MIKVFISQPFSGKTKEEVMKQRDNIVEKVKKFVNDEITVINQYDQDPPPVDMGCQNERVFYLGNSIKLMSTADLIVFSKDFKDAFGCMCEDYIADMYGFYVLYEETDI